MVSREELYELVWSIPMTKVAEKFSVKDVRSVRLINVDFVMCEAIVGPFICQIGSRRFRMEMVNAAVAGHPEGRVGANAVISVPHLGQSRLPELLAFELFCSRCGNTGQKRLTGYSYRCIERC